MIEIIFLTGGWMVRFVKRYLFLFVTVCLLFGALGPSLITAEGEGVYLVSAKSKTGAALLEESLEENHFIPEKIYGAPVYRVKTSYWGKFKLSSLVSELPPSERGEFKKEGQLKVFATPNDPLYSSQWALSNIKAAEAWDISTGSNSIVVAVLDSGLRGSHEEFSDGRAVAGMDFTTEPDTPISAGANSDDHGHGTKVSGIIGAATNNAKGIAGVNWNIKIMPLKVCDQLGDCWWGDVIAGIYYAKDHGAKIINMSLGAYGSPPQELVDAVNAAYNAGMVVVAAAGNGGGPPVAYPASINSVVAAGCNTSSDSRCSFSSYGPELDVVAPGYDIYTTDFSANNGYTHSSGTSFSSPHVAALAALIWAKNPSLTNAQVIDSIINGADKVSGMQGANFHQEYGYGRINLKRSLELAGGSSPPNAGIIKGSGTQKYLLDGSYKHPIDDFNMTLWGYTQADVVTYPDATINAIPTGFSVTPLLKGSADSVYLMDSGSKHYITSNTLVEWGFSQTDVRQYSDNLVNSLRTGANVTSLAKGSGSAVYLVKDGYKQWIKSPLAFVAWGFAWADIRTYSDTLINSLKTGGSISHLVKTSSRPEVYLVDAGVKHHIPSPFHFECFGFRWEDIAVVSGSLFNQLPTGSNVTLLAKGSGAPVYLVENGYKHWIPNPDVFNRWGLNWSDIRVYSDDLINAIRTGASVTPLLKGSSSGVYLIENGYKHWIPNPDVFNRWGLNWSDIRVYSDSLVNNVWVGESLSHLIKGSSNRVYLVEKGQKRWITSPRVFKKRRYNWSDVKTLPDSLVNRLPEGGPIR